MFFSGFWGPGPCPLDPDRNSVQKLGSGVFLALIWAPLVQKSWFGCPNPGFGCPNPGFGCLTPGLGCPHPGFGFPVVASHHLSRCWTQGHVSMILRIRAWALERKYSILWMSPGSWRRAMDPRSKSWILETRAVSWKRVVPACRSFKTNGYNGLPMLCLAGHGIARVRADLGNYCTWCAHAQKRVLGIFSKYGLMVYMCSCILCVIWFW